MQTGFHWLDYSIFGFYVVGIIYLGLWMSHHKSKRSNAEDYFLAGRALPWWAIGTSCIAANISAEQLIGVSGSSFVMGLAMASYEFASAVILIFVGKFLLPIYMRKGVYTLPEFLEKRYDHRVRTSLAVFWLLVYIFVNLTSILYMGALAMHMIMGVPLLWSVIILASIAAIYSLYGGLTAVAWTDFVQVGILVLGGLVTTYIAMNIISDGHGVIIGIKQMYYSVPEKFHMVFAKGHPNYKEIPGISGIVIGILLVANTFYWGTNQYTLQRALAGKSIREAQHGLMFAGYLKMIIPILVVLPGIAAYVMISNPSVMARVGHVNPSMVPSVEHADKAYPFLLDLLPLGFKGLAFAALVAAIVASLASKLNSTATIFTMDIYKAILRKGASQRNLVTVGRLTAGIALLIAVVVAPMLTSLSQAFMYIQEFTGFVSPGIVAIFLMGMFWKRTTSNAALWMGILTIPVTLAFYFFTDVPFLLRMGYVLGIISCTGIIISLLESKVNHPKAIEIEKGMFNTSKLYVIMAVGILAFLAVFYYIFW
jgi:solute:Na+ symporter, SSS family